MLFREATPKPIINSSKNSTVGANGVDVNGTIYKTDIKITDTRKFNPNNNNTKVHRTIKSKSE